MDCTKKDRSTIFNIKKERKQSLQISHYDEKSINLSNIFSPKFNGVETKSQIFFRTKKKKMMTKVLEETSNNVKEFFGAVIKQENLMSVDISSKNLRVKLESDVNMLDLTATTEDNKSNKSSEQLFQNKDRNRNNYANSSLGNVLIKSASNSESHKKNQTDIFLVPNFLNDRKISLTNSLNSSTTSPSKNSLPICPYNFENKELYIVQYDRMEARNYYSSGIEHFNEDKFFNFDQ